METKHLNPRVSRAINIANSYFIIIFSSSLLVAYFVLYEQFSTSYSYYISAAYIGLLQLLVLSILPLFSLLTNNPDRLGPYLEYSIYITGILSLCLIAYVINKTGGLFSSHMSWSFGYLFVLSVQLRVFAEENYSWRAPITTLLIIFSLSLFLELQSTIHCCGNEVTGDNKYEGFSSLNKYLLDWSQYAATLVGVLFTQLAIDLSVNKKIGEKAVILACSLKQIGKIPDA